MIALAIALVMAPAISQPTDVGGNFGKNWLQSSGNKHIIPQSTGLWDWGNMPKGQVLVNGKMVQAGPGYLLNPSSNLPPIFLNEGTPGEMAKKMNSSQLLNNTMLLEDPWYVAASTGRPVLVRTGPY